MVSLLCIRIQAYAARDAGGKRICSVALSFIHHTVPLITLIMSDNVYIGNMCLVVDSVVLFMREAK